MRILRPALVLTLAVTTSACSGHVADTSIAPGDRVRVTAPSLELSKSIGTVAALESDTLVINAEQRGDALAVPVADLTKLEVHRGQKSRAGRGALIGAGVGAASGAVTAILLCGGEPYGCHVDGSDLTAAVAIIFGLGGAALGAGIGALIGSGRRVDRWEEVPPNNIRVGLSPVTPDGVGVSVTLRL